mmetsp:Transcript_27011/g.69479  ORF Transcript_27011/g.69479 Transcript_27011/m.69479 type:complete len:215 (-) Transcript_27011:333-977(-)
MGCGQSGFTGVALEENKGEKPAVQKNRGGKEKKSKKANKLSKEEIDLIRDKCSLTVNEVEGIFTNVLKEAGQTYLAKDQFTALIKRIGVFEPHLQDRLFSAFDHDGNAEVDFVEFASTIGVLAKGRTEDKIKFCFTLYDTDGDGMVTPNEFKRAIRSLVVVLPLEDLLHFAEGKKYTNADDLVNQIVERVMAELDTDDDGLITIEEWKKVGCPH